METDYFLEYLFFLGFFGGFFRIFLGILGGVGTLHKHKPRDNQKGVI